MVHSVYQHYILYNLQHNGLHNHHSFGNASKSEANKTSLWCPTQVRLLYSSFWVAYRPRRPTLSCTVLGALQAMLSDEHLRCLRHPTPGDSEGEYKHGCQHIQWG